MAMSTKGRDFIPYPTNRVVGTVADAAKAQAAIAALLQAGFDREDIDILHGEDDLKRLDLTGAEHGFLAQFHRTLIRALETEEFKHLTHHVEDVRAGRYVIMVLTKRRVQRIAAADILHHYGAEFVGFYGRWACHELPAHPHQTPEEIPGLFVEAWNDRDPDALAALFDEDAQFVNVTGQCCRDRESIRKAHATGLGIFTNTILSIDDTKVKYLSPDVAVVHSRVTMSGQAPGAAAQAAPRATLLSFVVHRTLDWWKWQCASVHHTDVAAAPEPRAIPEAGLPGIAPYPTRQMS
jgi:uncharacterized protein (TIGR02246 family)